MRIINISAAAKNHLGDNFDEFMEQISSSAIAVIEPLSAYGFVKNGVEHVYIECDDEGQGSTPISEISGSSYEVCNHAEIRQGSKVKLADSRYIVDLFGGEFLHPEKVYTVCQANYQDGALESISLNEIISSDFMPEYFKLVNDAPTVDMDIPMPNGVYCSCERKAELFDDAMKDLEIDSDESALVTHLMNEPKDVIKKLIDAGWRPFKEQSK